MRRRILRAALVAGALFVSPAFAADDGKVTLTGEVVDSACYIKSGAKGIPPHVRAECADAGIRWRSSRTAPARSSGSPR